MIVIGKIKLILKPFMQSMNEPCSSKKWRFRDQGTSLESLYKFRKDNVMLRFLFLAAHLLAAPPHPEDYRAPQVGLVKLQDGAWIEGSVGHGGATHDFEVNWSDPVFDKIKKLARDLKNQGLAAYEIADRLSLFIKKEVFLEGSTSTGYTQLIAKNRPILLSEYVASQVASCREHAYLLHMALSEAGVRNRLAYARTRYAIEGSTDHAFVIYQDGENYFLADSTNYKYFDGKSLIELLSHGDIIKTYFFPKYWNPVHNLSAINIKIKSFQEFQALLIDVVKNSREIQSLQETAQPLGVQIKLGGGALRGILSWITEQLKDHTPDQIRSLPIPSIRSLLLNPHSDLDLYVEDHKKNLVKTLPAFKDWEIIEAQDFQESVKAGGCTLDKVLVGFDKIEDPLGGLMSFYKGELDYQSVDPEIIRSTYWFKSQSNSETAMALRFLRVMQDFPELTVSDKVLAKIKSVAELDTPQLKEENRYWVSKALIKFSASSFYDSVSSLVILKNLGFLEPLTQKGFFLSSKNSIIYDDQDLKRFGFTQKEIELSKEFIQSPYSYASKSAKLLAQAKSQKEGIDVLDKIIAETKSAEDFTLVFARSAISSRTDYLQQVREKAILKHLSRFLALSPSVSQIKNLIHQSNFNSTIDKRIYIEASKTLKTHEEFKDLYSPLTKNYAIYHNQPRDEAFLESIDLYLKLKPTIGDVKELIQELQLKEETNLVIYSKAAGLAKTPEEFGQFLEALGSDKKYQNEIRGEAALANLDTYLNLKPSIQNIREFIFSHAFHDEVDRKIYEASAKLAHTPQEFILLFTPLFQKIPAHLKALSNALNNNVEYFMQLKPTPEQIESLVTQENISDHVKVKILTFARPYYPDPTAYRALLNRYPSLKFKVKCSSLFQSILKAVTK